MISAFLTFKQAEYYIFTLIGSTINKNCLNKLITSENLLIDIMTSTSLEGESFSVDDFEVFKWIGRFLLFLHKFVCAQVIPHIVLLFSRLFASDYKFVIVNLFEKAPTVGEIV